MKTPLLIPFFILCIFHPSQAQNDSIVIKKVYRTWIIPKERARIKQGILFEVKDSSLVISNRHKQKDYDLGKFTITNVDVHSIDVIKVRKTGRLGIGFLAGSGVGVLATGTLIAVVKSNKASTLGDAFGQFFLAVMGSAFLMGSSILIGAAIAGHKTKISINGSQQQFDQNKSRLNGYSIKQNPAFGVFGSKTFLKLSDTLVDIDGNVYHTLALGGQVWMAENLKVLRYRDGSNISDITIKAPEAGPQYNWFTVNHKVSLCPAGWHVPSLAEWTSLLASLGGEIRTGNKLEKYFSNKCKESQWWSSTEQDTLHAQSLYLNNETIGVMFTSSAKTDRLSVRCIRDY